MKIKQVIRYTLIAAIAVFALGISPKAFADSYDVKPGQTTYLFAFGRYDIDTCAKSNNPRYTLKQPENGQFRVVVRPTNLTGGRCKGKVLPFHWLSYTPKRGFRGQDRGSITYDDISYSDQVTPQKRHRRVILNVR